MTTNEGLLIGGLVLGGGILIYAMSSSQKKLLAASSTGSTIAGVGGLLGGLGSFIKGIGGSGGSSGKPPAAYGSLSTPNGAGPITGDSSGFTVTGAEQANIDAYDATGTASDPVFGIAGLDF
jgi:hypothetical protein